MKHLYLSWTLFVMTSAAVVGQTGGKLEASLDSLIRSEIDEKNIPSIAIGVVQDDKVKIAKGYGLADVYAKTPATASTVYQLGSVTKMFTGHLLAHLIRDGKIELDDPLSQHFHTSVNYPVSPDGQQVTIKHLATHSSDFPRYPANLERVDPHPIKGYTLEQLKAGIGLVEIDTVLGVHYQYSNFGYGVLGALIEHVMHHELNELLGTYVFDVLGMSSTAMAPNADMRTRLATPYLEVAPPVVTEPWEMGSLSAAGNLFSTVDDLNRFMLALLVDNDLNRIQQHPHLKINDNWSYGLGCFIIESNSKNTRIIYHGGDIDGYASSLTMYPEFGLGYVMLTNWGEGQIIGETFTQIDQLITAHLLKE